MMEWRVKCLVSLFAIPVMACAHSAAMDSRSVPQAAYAPASWVDPSTGLMWTGKDNGKGVGWDAAMKYCQALDLAGYSDWRLPTIDELVGIYDETASVPGLGGGEQRDQPRTWHVKGNLFLTGRQWSSTQRTDDLGRPEGFAWFFDFGSKYKSYTDSSRLFGDYRRALCVRPTGFTISAVADDEDEDRDKADPQYLMAAVTAQMQLLRDKMTNYFRVERRLGRKPKRTGGGSSDKHPTYQQRRRRKPN